MPYATANDIYLAYGKINTEKWADLDNNQNQGTIAARIAWALEISEYTLDSRLVTNRYAIPFTTVPRMVQYMTGILAGILLYEGRVVVDADPKVNQVRDKKIEFKTNLNLILSGRMRLIGATRVATNAPGVVNDEQTSERFNYEEYLLKWSDRLRYIPGGIQIRIGYGYFW